MRPTANAFLYHRSKKLRAKAASRRVQKCRNNLVSRTGLRRLVGPVYNGVVAAELAMERGRLASPVARIESGQVTNVSAHAD